MKQIETIGQTLRHDRRIVLSGIGVVTLLAWAYMAYEAHAMYSTGTCQCAGMKMSGPDADLTSPATLLPLFLMWAEMMVAMMLPTAAPMILAFAALQRKCSPERQPFSRTGIFTSGYLLVWTGFSLLAAVAQWQFNVLGLLSPMMESTSPLLGGILLIVAGLFQFAPLKNHCLARCRSREASLQSDWSAGSLGALQMGWKHGLQCAGCCWILMALLFVGGVMNLWWIALLSTFVLLEKILPDIRPLGRLAGAALATWGGWLLAFR